MTVLFEGISSSARFYSNLSYFHHIGKSPLKHISFGNLLELAANQFAERDAVVSVQENKRITYYDLLCQADRFAAGLQQIGLKYGDRVGIWAPNILEWTVCYFACARAGFVVATLNPSYVGQEVECCINKIGLKAIICPEKSKKSHFYDVLGTVINNLRNQIPGKLNSSNTPTLNSIVTVSENNLGGTFNYNDVMGMASEKAIKQIKANQDRVNPDNPVNIQFTSGTTGKPKAAVVSHYNLVNSSLSIGKRNELDTKHHKIGVQVPFFHTFGYTVTIGATVSYGATMVVPSPTYDPLLNLRAIKEENCTVIYGTPTMYVDLLNVQMQYNEKIDPEIAVSGGSPCSPELFKKMREHLKVKKVKSVYGLTEATAVVFQSMPSDDEDKMINTVEHLCDHLEVKVVDENDNVVPLGYTTMLGYWEDKAKTNEIIDSHHWLRTGDKFILDKDGYGRIVGRLKDMIIRGGENIFPKEIEDFLSTHPDILEVHVVGLSHKRLGEEVCACVKVRDGGGAKLTLEAIVDFCKENLAKFKIPSQLRIVEEFPKTQSGKIQKYLLKKQFEESR
ncbi:hypothetical protein RI129_006590 [Pyrocoelia pectoralis]|uniref:Medium-chain acyl-CoA ligase ACSF2, mitochondrial n=1 Tax=Pyrocoelia pectoralis TaxID=417401 RepID=A0AAN7ZGB2_9COLE